MSGLTRERGDTVIGPRTSQSVLSSLLYREPRPLLNRLETVKSQLIEAAATK